jgi:hypothetical protein
MMETNNMTAYQFTIALMAFLVAYSVFEVPSNLAMKILHPHRYFFRSPSSSPFLLNLR